MTKWIQTLLLTFLLSGAVFANEYIVLASPELKDVDPSTLPDLEKSGHGQDRVVWGEFFLPISRITRVHIEGNLSTITMDNGDRYLMRLKKMGTAVTDAQILRTILIGRKIPRKDDGALTATVATGMVPLHWLVYTPSETAEVPKAEAAQ